MDNLCASGVDLLPEKSRLSQMNTATNKVNLIPSHYPPPGIAEAERTIGGAELLDGKFIMLSPAHPFPVCVDFEQKGVVDRNTGSKDSVPPPLPPREPTGCCGAAVRHVPLPMSPTLKDVLNKHQLAALNLAQVGGQADGPGGHGGQVNANIGFDCFGNLTVLGEQHEPVLANSSPMIHHEHHRLLKNVDDITHHNWNAIQANLSHELVTGKDFYPVNQVLDDKPCDGSLKMASTNLQSTVLNQVIPLSRWPIGSRQPETHFALDRVVARPQAGNEYVDSPLHAQNKEQPHLTPKRSNTLTARSETSLRDCNAVIMTQPSPSGIKSSEEPAGKAGDRANSRNPPPPPPCKQGLICPRCGKCRCLACTEPRHLPSCWIGRSFYPCEIGGQQVVNCCSCLCCVQALFYHCLYHPDDEDDVVIEPCACCERPRCCLRWTIMGLLLPVLPCLCLYCPLQCALDAITACYNGCSRRGCHCGRDVSSSGSSTTRDLLLDSEPSST